MYGSRYLQGSNRKGGGSKAQVGGQKWQKKWQKRQTDDNSLL